MIYAVFSADRKVIEQFQGDDGIHGSMQLASEALRRRGCYGDFVDRLCTTHQEPWTDCRGCGRRQQ
ncbi:hypothetical protein [Streptomyces abikoensis]|uniref:Uncharacterized protein n=1 Tax=Streptomyces abikoensis TaxID=97398 RepID=A0ABW7TBS9_9ACTN